MKCPERDTLLDYVEEQIEDCSLTEQVAAHVGACSGCREWVATYRLLQQASEEEVAPIPEQVPPFEWTPTLQAAVQRGAEAESRASRGDWTVWFRRFWIPAVAVAGLLIASLWFFGRHGLEQTKNVQIELQGIAYRVWGDPASLDRIQTGTLPPALQSPETQRYLGFLTPELRRTLQHPQNSEVFWDELRAALSAQEIQIPPSVHTLLVEGSLFGEARSSPGMSDRKLWVHLHGDAILRIQVAR